MQVCARLRNQTDAVGDVDEDVSRGVDGAGDAAEEVEAEHPAEEEAAQGHPRLDLDTHHSENSGAGTGAG